MGTVDCCYRQFRSTYSRHDKSLRCWCFWRLSRKRLTIDATTNTFLERSRKDLSGNVWVVALIVNRFRDKRQKHQHRSLNSYRGDYIIIGNIEFLGIFYIYRIRDSQKSSVQQYMYCHTHKSSKWV